MCSLDSHQFSLFFNEIVISCNIISLEFHVPFENLFIHWLLNFFVCKGYVSCLCCAKAMSVEYIYLIRHFGV